MLDDVVIVYWVLPLIVIPPRNGRPLSYFGTSRDREVLKSAIGPFALSLWALIFDRKDWYESLFDNILRWWSK